MLSRQILSYKIFSEEITSRIIQLKLDHFGTYLAITTDDLQFFIIDIFIKKIIYKLNLSNIVVDPIGIPPIFHFSKNPNFFYLFQSKPDNSRLSFGRINAETLAVSNIFEKDYKYNFLPDKMKKNQFVIFEGKTMELHHLKTNKSVSHTFDFDIYNIEIGRKMNQDRFFSVMGSSNLKIVKFNQENDNFEVKTEMNFPNEKIKVSCFDKAYNFFAYIDQTNTCKIFNMDDELKLIGYKILNLGHNIDEINFYLFPKKFECFDLFLLATRREEKDKLSLNFRSIETLQYFDQNIINIFELPFIIVEAWDHSIVTVDEDSGNLRIFEWKSEPSWVNFGFRFTNIDRNIEYIEKEDEFDKKDKANKTREINMKVNPSKLGFNWKVYYSPTPKTQLTSKYLIN